MFGKGFTGVETDAFLIDDDQAMLIACYSGERIMIKSAFRLDFLITNVFVL